MATTALAGLELHYQPIVSLGTGGREGVEGLLRRRMPTGAVAGAGEVLAQVEAAGEMAALWEWTLATAASAAATAFAAERVWVNLSAAQLTAATADALGATLERCGVGPERIGVEVVETAFYDDELLARQVGAMAGMGVAVHLDDFGTGVCNLAMIEALPVAGIKLDRRLVGLLDHPARSGRMERVLRAVVGMAHDLGLVVVGEGVERPRQAEALAGLGCDLAQGYLFGRPAPAGQGQTATAP
ncbi:MAG TPA: EAL domain-containing protein [Acidimicrobiales bacterium]|nr:EAL domain-containing protein [Acidimicrobiales bacterium]